MAVYYGICLEWPGVARADNTAGYDISPIYQDVAIGQSQARGKYQITLSNKTPLPQEFKLSTVDFGSLNSSGGVAFLGVSSSQFAQQYGLSKWMQLDQSDVNIAAGDSAIINVNVNNSPDMQPGGHYGAVLATALTAPNGPASESRVGVLGVLSSLILLIKGGVAAAHLKLISVQAERSWWSMPVSVVDRFLNAGDVHVVPRGVVEIRDEFGNVRERGGLDVDSGIILPQSVRDYRTPLVVLSSALWPGRYQVTTSYRFDGTTKTNSNTTYFYYPGAWYLDAGCLGGIVILACGMVWAKSIWNGKKRSKAAR